MSDFEPINIATKTFSIDHTVDNSLFTKMYVEPLHYQTGIWNQRSKVSFDVIEPLYRDNPHLFIPLYGGYGILYLGDEVDTCIYVYYKFLKYNWFESSIPVHVIYPFYIWEARDILPNKQVKVRDLAHFNVDTPILSNLGAYINDSVLLSSQRFEGDGVFIKSGLCCKAKIEL